MRMETKTYKFSTQGNALRKYETLARKRGSFNRTDIRNRFQATLCVTSNMLANIKIEARKIDDRFVLTKDPLIVKLAKTNFRDLSFFNLYGIDSAEIFTLLLTEVKEK